MRTDAVHLPTLSASPRRALLVPAIPAPRLRKVYDGTPFSLFVCQKMGVGRRFYDVIVVKGTFELAAGTLQRAEGQAPVVLADEPWDPSNAGRSSLKRAGEVTLGKPGTDVLVTGHARSPQGRPAPRWDCSVIVKRAGSVVVAHTLEATGPRRWEHSLLGGWRLSPPAPATEVPIRYELAYGGAYDTEVGEAKPVVHRENPSGSGVFDELALDRSRAYPAPQWQVHAEPVTAMNVAVAVAGLGPVARTWSSRRRFAGTYDAAWEGQARSDAERGVPLDYPADFDARFFHVAPPALRTPAPLAGDEEILLGGLRETPTVVRLPGMAVEASLRIGMGSWTERAMPLDTVHFDLDAERVHLCWRLCVDGEEDARGAVIGARDMHGGAHVEAHR
jgi:hypothetical protein